MVTLSCPLNRLLIRKALYLEGTCDRLAVPHPTSDSEPGDGGMRGPGEVRPEASLAGVGCDSDVAASKTASQNLYIFEQAVRTPPAAAGPNRRSRRRRRSARSPPLRERERRERERAAAVMVGLTYFRPRPPRKTWDETPLSPDWNSDCAAYLGWGRRQSSKCFRRP